MQRSENGEKDKTAELQPCYKIIKWNIKKLHVHKLCALTTHIKKKT